MGRVGVITFEKQLTAYYSLLITLKEPNALHIIHNYNILHISTHSDFSPEFTQLWL